jgi:Tfp pilus assembly protein PilF
VPLYLIGLTYHTCGKTELAMEYYEKAIQSNRCNADAWNNKGGIFYKRGERQKAIECFEEAADMGNEEARQNLEALR